MVYIYIFFFFFKPRTAYEISAYLVGSEMYIGDRYRFSITGAGCELCSSVLCSDVGSL